MTSLAPVVPLRQIQTTRRSHPLLSVMAWEARRVFASRSAWISALVALGLFLLAVWVGHAPVQMGVANAAGSFNASVAGTSAWGLIVIFPIYLLFPFALVLPFVCTEGVARDLKRRTHELVMTTALPTWAYVWGRYLIVLLLSLGLATLLLAVILAMGLFLHLTEPDYPTPEIGAVVAIWAIMAVPTVILLSGLSFALGTLLPQHANQVKIGMIIFWFLGVVVLPILPTGGQQLPSWYLTWEPTGLGMSATLGNQYAQIFQPFLSAETGDPFAGLIPTEQRMPDLWPWLAPHLFWAALGLALVALAASAFKRFRQAPNPP